MGRHRARNRRIHRLVTGDRPPHVVPHDQHAGQEEDAAENASVVYDAPITTQQPSNNSLGALPGPGASAASGLARGVGQPNGFAASEGARLRLGQRGRLTRSFAKRALGISAA